MAAKVHAIVSNIHDKENTVKSIKSRWRPRTIICILTIAVLALPAMFFSSFASVRTAYADSQPVFPDAHQDFLGGGSYAALFGNNTDPLSPGPSSPTGTGRPPRVGPNVRVNDPQLPFPKGLLGRSETTIASTDDGQFLVAGWNDARGFLRPPFGNTLPGTPGLSGYGFSTDGGLTWTDAGAPPVINHIVTRGDPWLDRGGLDNATFYYANLAVDDRLPGGQVTLGVSVHMGHFNNGVLTWSDVRLLQAPNYPNDFYDKESITMAKDGSGAGYVSVTNFRQLCGIPAFGFGQIEVWRTHDGGNTWQGPAIAGPDLTNTSTCDGSGVLQQSSSVGIGPNGEVYVTWQLGPTFSPSGTPSTNASIVVARSLDGGVTFSTPVVVANINSMRQDPPVGYNRNRLNDHPRIAVATSGPHKGRVYVVYYSADSPVTAAPIVPCPAGVSGTCIGQNLVSSQVSVTFSDDRGATWSTPTPLAPAVPATGVKRFWPVVSVEPGGNVDVVYYESQEQPTTSNPTCNVGVGGGVRRVGTANSLVNTFWVQSLDGGSTFSAPLKVSTATSNWCTTATNIRPNFGDYIGSASGGNHIFPTWADGRNGVPDTFYATILAGKS
jgi:hypothetical protein